MSRQFCVSHRLLSDVGSYAPVDLTGWCNAGLELLAGYRRPPTGDQVFHGLPFRIGNPDDAQAPCFIVLEPGNAVTVPVSCAADHIIIAHRRLPAGDRGGPTVGSAVAEYTLRLAGGPQPDVPVPIRERFEIAVIPEEGWDASGPFLAAFSAQLQLADRSGGRWEDLGMRQSEGVFPSLADYFLWIWENPLPDGTCTPAISSIHRRGPGIPCRGSRTTGVRFAPPRMPALSAETTEPRFSMTPMWKDLPDDQIGLVVEGFDEAGREACMPSWPKRFRPVVAAAGAGLAGAPLL